MATKKIYTEYDAYKEFISVLTRSKFDEFIINNNILICKKDNKSYIFKLGDKLYPLFINDENYKDKFENIENDEENLKILSLINKADDNHFLELDGNELYNGDKLETHILSDDSNINETIELNKGIFPCRLLKKEFRDISYDVIFSNNSISFIIKKEFKNKLEGFEFILFQIFQVI